MTPRKRVVAVIGPAQCTADEGRTAETVGRLLAERGAVLLCGGRGGVMEAACRGASQAGGLTIGLLPGPTTEDGNPHLGVALPTAMGEGRNVLVVRGADAVIAISGSYGTLSEVALALKMGKKVIGLGTWQATSPSGEKLAIISAGSPEEAVSIAWEAASQGA